MKGKITIEVSVFSPNTTTFEWYGPGNKKITGSMPTDKFDEKLPELIAQVKEALAIQAAVA